MKVLAVVLGNQVVQSRFKEMGVVLAKLAFILGLISVPKTSAPRDAANRQSKPDYSDFQSKSSPISF